MYLYDFIRVPIPDQPENQIGYAHDHFRRGRPDLLANVLYILIILIEFDML
jgi:hypothetical protein